MNSTTATFTNNSNQYVVGAATVAASTATATQLLFCESPNKTNMNHSRSIVRGPKRLTSLLSSPLFASAPYDIIESSSSSSSSSSSKVQYGGEAPDAVEEKNEEAKAKPSRFSIGGNKITSSDIANHKVFFEGPFYKDGDSIVIIGPTCEDNGDGEVDVEPHRKKQKKLLGEEEELRREECVQAEDDCFALAKVVRERGTTGGGDDAAKADREDAMAVPMIHLDDKDDDFDEFDDRKIHKWSRELLALKKKLDDARVRT
jgi:hypothetical protein